MSSLTIFQQEMTDFFSGALMLAFWVSGVFFIRFWRKTHDRLFVWFAAAFWTLAFERLLLEVLNLRAEDQPLIYTIRLAAFAMIAIGIVEKNRASPSE
jgi:hypothetical protein